MILQTGKCPITTFSSDLNFQIFKFKCDQESLERKARVSEMEEEKNITSLLPAEMLEKIFCHLSFHSLKVKLATYFFKMLWSEVDF